ncbi:MAG TPA: aminomethyl-transferring glycine dehydrogenase subunit GcvPA [Thermoplasmata archaeon]|nr:aminomethyl-transferring glycine dehydrogenase subunit GcvPA [Thermoplasmata archaeon]
MRNDPRTVHPYIPNSARPAREAMLREVGAESEEDFYEDIPAALRFRGQLDLPDSLPSEHALRRHVAGLLSKNRSTTEILNFLGAGCYEHMVPAVCDEINSRGEFLTAYAGEPYDDHGRFQALFEYASLMGELLDMDVVNVPTYDGFQATATALRMAARITGRSELLVSRAVSADKLSKIRDYAKPRLTVKTFDYDASTGEPDLSSLESQVGRETAAVYFENPSYLGVIATHGPAVSDCAHEAGALSVVGVDPSTLGVLTPPVDYGADLVVGDLQPLGMHMQFGGGHAGFIASRDEPRFVMEYPSRLFGITSTSVDGEYGFGDVAYDRTSFARREQGKEWVGTAAALWGITAGAYLALLGPEGMRDLGESMMIRSHYAARRLSRIPGVRAPRFRGSFFHEFVVDYRRTGKTIATVNRALLRRGILGGKDLSREFPELKGCALYCITEVHAQEDMDRLVDAVREVVA